MGLRVWDLGLRGTFIEARSVGGFFIHRQGVYTNLCTHEINCSHEGRPRDIRRVFALEGLPLKMKAGASKAHRAVSAQGSEAHAATGGA